MRRFSNRWIARLLLLAVLFAQAGVAFADCPIDRGHLNHALSVEPMQGCESSMTVATEYGPLYANRCVAHCTSDLQVSAAAVAIVRSAASAPVLLVPRGAPKLFVNLGLSAPPPGTLPARILLHSFLI